MRNAFTPYARRLGRELMPDAYDWLHGALAAGDVLAAFEEEALVAAAATRRSDEHLIVDLLAVCPERQGDGLGASLLARVEEAARGKGLAAVALNTAEVMADLLRFYQRHGFTEVRRAPPEHGKDAYLRVHMRKDL